MVNWIYNLRYGLEMLSLPAFAFLVIHLAGRGASILLTSETYTESAKVRDNFYQPISPHLASSEVFLGIALLMIFVGLWHKAQLRRLVPCRHENCHQESLIAHLVALMAFGLHLIPEAGIRQAVLEQWSVQDWTQLLSMSGFGAHFLVDIMVASLLIIYWRHWTQKAIALVLIVLVWSSSLLAGDLINGYFINSAVEGWMFLLSAFLLAMLIHLPHQRKMIKIVQSNDK